MKKGKIRKPGFSGELGEQLEKTVEEGKEQVSVGNFIEDILGQLFGQAKPVSQEKMSKLEKEEEEEARRVRAQVLREFMGPPKEDKEEQRIYYQKQREEAAKKMEERKKAEEEAKKKMVAPPRGRKKRGSLFEHLRRKVSKAERKMGKF